MFKSHICLKILHLRFDCLIVIYDVQQNVNVSYVIRGSKKEILLQALRLQV